MVVTGFVDRSIGSARLDIGEAEPVSGCAQILHPPRVRASARAMGRTHGFDDAAMMSEVMWR